MIMKTPVELVVQQALLEPSSSSGSTTSSAVSDGEPDTCCSGWTVKPSQRARRTTNPIRAIVESMRPPSCGKELISLSLGDPCAHGCLRAPRFLSQLVADAALSGAGDGYCHSAGTPAARAAIADTYSTPASPLTADDVLIAAGCSGALDLVLGALLDPGDNILVPQPGFPLYKVIAESLGAEVRQYRLLPERGWEVDLEHMASLADGRTQAIIVNNPSNPCGSVFLEEHMRAILSTAAAHRLTIIADEVYGSLAFPAAPRPFIPFAALPAATPLITVGSLAKMCLVPGWRCGWAIVRDRGCGGGGDAPLAGVRAGMAALSQVSLGACALVQAALPEALGPSRRDELREFHLHYSTFLQDNAHYLVKRINAMPGLSCLAPPQGAMFAMIHLDGAHLPPALHDDVAFADALLRQEALALLPGAAFGAPGHVRACFCAPLESLQEACDRLEGFVRRHRGAKAAAAVEGGDSPIVEVCEEDAPVS